MKIRKFNESLDNEIDTVYIRQCFADLIDSGAANVEEREASSVGKFVSISISMFEVDRIISPVKTSFVSKNNSLMNYIDTQNKNNDRLQDIKLSLERLADEYPNYKISVEHFTSIFIKIFTS
jgi:isocitrate dehydrogenase kinase/phosphatase